MPLQKPKKRASKKEKQKIASKNISKEIKAGKPKAQAIAIGLTVAGLGKKKNQSKSTNKKTTAKAKRPVAKATRPKATARKSKSKK